MPEIVDAVGDRATLFVDRGVRSGLDVLKFLGLGAKACFIGRAYLYGLYSCNDSALRRRRSPLHQVVETSVRARYP